MEMYIHHTGILNPGSGIGDFPSRGHALYPVDADGHAHTRYEDKMHAVAYRIVRFTASRGSGIYIAGTPVHSFPNVDSVLAWSSYVLAVLRTC